jgi:hypothetical protein
MGLLHHVRQSQVEQVAGLLRVMDKAQDPVSVISALLRVSRRSGARVGLAIALTQGQTLRTDRV